MIVYCATNRVNGKAYVGVTSQPLARRLSQHKSRAGRLNQAFPNALAKHGFEAFRWDVLAHCADAEALQAAETFFIRHLNTLADGGHGYNRTAGGGGTVGFKFSEQSRKQMSEKHVGRNTVPMNRWGKQLRLFHHEIGKKHSVEHIEKMRASLRGTHNARRLHPEFAPAILAMREAGQTHDQIAAVYGVSRPAISLYLKRYGG